jgi:multidrug resistance efflux pump
MVGLPNRIPPGTKWLGALCLLASFAVPAQMLGQVSEFVAPGHVEGAGPPMSIGVAATGVVSDVLVHEGSRVQAGQLLAKLDCRAQEADVGTRQARLAAAQAAYDKFRNGSRPDEIAVGEAVVNFSKARADEAQKTLQRTMELQEGVTVTAARVLEVQRDARIALAQLAEAQAQLNLLRAGAREEDVRQAKALRDAAAADLDEARARLDQCSVTAPADGVVLDVLISKGQFLSVAVPQPLLHIVPDGPARVRAEVALADLPHVCLQQHATIAAEAFPNAAMTAQVATIGAEVDRSATVGATSDHPDSSGAVAVVLTMDRGAPALPIGLLVSVHFEPCPTKS